MFKTISLFLALAGPCVAAKSPEAPSLRLPNSAAPNRYAANLTIVPDKDTFQGSVDIDVDIKQPEDLLWLNATKLNIHEATLKTGGQTYQATVVPGGDNFVGLRFEKPVSGSGTLHMVYDGSISRNSSAGLFQMKDGDHWYVYTQFEPTDARRVFPSFDEPSYKVPWQLTLHVPANDMAVSNTPALAEAPENGGMKTVTFGITKPLPSYLVALAVGPFDAVGAGKVGRAPVRIIVPKGRGGEAKFAAESIPQLLKLLEQYFGTPYPYEKLDSVVMPISNFAMENAGMITYGQSLLLAKPDNDTIERQRECAIVTAHEMAHQWFGDLVTTSWWNDIWLNEAFATWMENKITGEWKPEWSLPITEVDSRLGAENLDSLASTRKIRQPIVSDDDIANAFDDITYQKGAAVIHMFEHWIGSDTFRKGVRLYIKQHANGTATTSDFEATIGAAAGKNIAPAFNSFLDQPGVPLLTVALDCGSKHPALKLSQKRSLPIGSPGSAQQTWQLPVCVKYQVDGEVYNECDLLSDPNSGMTLKHARKCPDWVLANDEEVGYYRVDYQGDLLKQVLAEGAANLSVAERVGLLGDVNALVNSGEVSPKLALSLVPQFGKDSDRHIVESALEIANMLSPRMLPEDLQPKAAAYIRQVFGPRALQLGWQPKPEDDENTKLLRQNLVEDVALDGQQQELIDQAGKLAREWLKDHKAIEPGMLSPVLHVAAAYGDRDFFEQLKAAALAEKDQRTRETLIGALGSFRDPEIAKSAMALLLTKDFDAREAFYPLLFGPLSYRETRALPFEFVKNNLDALLAKLPREVGADFAANLPEVGRAFCDAQHRAEVQSFFGERVKQYTGGPRNLMQTLESIDVCIARKNALEPEMSAFLRARE
jgi:alanyl aminopeptidase